MRIFNYQEESVDKVKEGLDLILSHFEGRQQLFPRKISTDFSNGRQFIVYNKEQTLEECTKANFIDCRINAYPPFTDYYGINRTPISFLMIDLDLRSFGRRGEGEDSKKKKGKILLEKALNKTLEKIKKETIGGNPTVLWTGNGYHLYQPVSNGIILEEYETFYEFTKYLDKDLTSLFIQFAEDYFTDYAADRLHNPTVK